MSLLHNRTKPDRRAGIVLITVFTLGILGASLAAFLNGGDLPQSAYAHAHTIKISAPL